MTKTQGKLPTLARRFRDFIREARVQKGLSLRQLSEATDLSINTLQKYEGTDQSPSASKLARLCMALDLDPREALRFALGDGEGEHLQASNPELLANYDAFVRRFSLTDPQSLTQGIQLLRFLVDIMEATARHAEAPMNQLSGSFHDQLSSMSAMLPGLMRDVVNDPGALASLTPEARALITQTKNGPEREAPSRSLAEKPKNEVGASSKKAPRRKAKGAVVK